MYNHDQNSCRDMQEPHSKPKHKLRLCLAICLVTLGVISNSATASSLTYQPINPTFGGNPNYTAHLFSRAEAINDYEGDSSSRSTRSSVDSLLSSLQSRLLGELIASGEPGSLETDDYSLTITDNDGFLTISIYDKTTGESTAIEVSGL